MDDLVFAPIIIATLNRAEHFKRCVESLRKCKYADKTELFISVDYPPAERYEAGYQQVCDYLDKGILGFKEVHVFYQEKNLGAKNNLRFLREFVLARFDRYIVTEDDNEFSYNFLEYMNKGLKIFEEDDRILNICALQNKGPWDSADDTVIFQQDCPSYGLGLWRHKEIELEKIITKYLLVDIGENPNMINYLWKQSKISYQQYIEGILCGKNPIFWKDDEGIRLCDTVRTIYAICANKYFVAPKITKSRNWGLDGSGVNMGKKKIDPCKVWEIDMDDNFEFRFSFDKKKIDKYNEYIHGHISKVWWLYIFKAKIKYFLYLGKKWVKSK